MKLVATREALLLALDRCAAATDNAGTFSYSQSVRLSADGDVLTLTATNGVLLVDTAVVSKGSANGSCAVACDKLTAFVRALPPSSGVQMQLSADGSKLLLKNSNRKCTLPTRDISEYPQVPEADQGSASINIDGALLARLVGRVKHAVDRDRPQLDLVRIVMDGGHVEAMALCNHRLARAREKNDDGQLGEILLPTKFIGIVDTLLADKELQSVKLMQDERRVYAETDDTLLMALLPAERLSTWNEMWELTRDNLSPLCRVSSAALTATARALTAVRGMSQEHIVLAMDPAEKTLVLEAKSQDGSYEAQDKLAITPTGESRTIAIQADYMLDALRACEGDVVLSVNTALHFEAEGFVGVVMGRSQ